MRLPVEKLLRLRKELRTWLSRTARIKRSLFSLIGSLQHAASVVPAGRAFVRQLIDASKDRRQLSKIVHLNAEAKADLRWWNAFLEEWNGKGFFSTAASKPQVYRGKRCVGYVGLRSGMGIALVPLDLFGCVVATNDRAE